MTAVLLLSSRAPQCLAVTHQLVQAISRAWDLAEHPNLENLSEFLLVGPIEQVKEGGIRRPALELQPQSLVQRFPVPAGKGLQITGAAAAAQDPQYRHQQQEPLRVTYPTAVTTIRDRLEEADQINRSRLIDCSEKGVEHWGAVITTHQHQL